MSAARRMGRIIAGWAAIAVAHGTAAAPAFTLPASAHDTMTGASHLQEFARPAAAEIERVLAVEPAPAEERLGVVLAMRVHLALLRRDGPRALDSAEKIRARQAAGAERAFAGLTTRAAVASWAAPRAAQAAAFAAEFRRLLGPLPRSPEMLAVLARQRDRLQVMTEPTLRAEAVQLGAKIGDRRQITLEEADQIVRLGHRLENLLPLRDAMLAALNDAIAAR